jgi:hypothetical protein
MSATKRTQKPETQSTPGGGPPKPPKKTTRGFDDESPDDPNNPNSPAYLDPAERARLEEFLKKLQQAKE